MACNACQCSAMKSPISGARAPQRRTPRSGAACAESSNPSATISTKLIPAQLHTGSEPTTTFTKPMTLYFPEKFLWFNGSRYRGEPKRQTTVSSCVLNCSLTAILNQLAGKSGKAFAKSKVYVRSHIKLEVKQ